MQNDYINSQVLIEQLKNQLRTQKIEKEKEFKKNKID